MPAATWYEDTAIADPVAGMCLQNDTDCDVAIVGGGLAGLSLLYHLIQAGIDAVLIEKDSVGHGASGRNGGFCSSGWAADEPAITRLVGPHDAARLGALAQEGLDWMRAKSAQADYHSTDARPGILGVALSGKPGDQPVLKGAALTALVDSPRYKFGVLEPAAFQFHPLNFMRCLAAEITGLGGRIFSNTALLATDTISHRLHLRTAKGTLRANRVVLATGGYGGASVATLSRLILPIRTYIGVTARLSADDRRMIKTPYAIGDTRRAGNYYRMLPDNRLLWGHSITAFGTLDQDRIKTNTARDIASIFPHMSPEITYGWAGNMAYAVHKMPIVGELAPNLYSLCGFGGHGMNTAPAAALVLAEHLARQTDRLSMFAAIPKAWNMGRAGPFAVEASYRLMQGRDFLAEKFGR